MSFFGSYILNTAHLKQPSGLGMITGTFEKRAPENRTQELGTAEQEGPVLISDSWLFSIWVINHLWCPWKMIFCLEKFGDVGRAGKNNTVQTTFNFLLPSPFDVSIRVNTVEDNNTTTFIFSAWNFRKGNEVLIPIIFGSLDFQLGNPNRWKLLGDKNMPISTG